MLVKTQKYGNVKIRWQYDNKNNATLTKAFIEKDKEIIKQIEVRRHPKDQHNKELARKFALTKLVKESFSRTEDLFDRKEVWNAYRNR